MPSGCTPSPTVSEIASLPDFALIDVRVVAALRSVSVNQTWRDARSGKIPAPIRLSSRATRWKLGDIRKHLEELSPA